MKIYQFCVFVPFVNIFLKLWNIFPNKWWFKYFLHVNSRTLLLWKIVGKGNRKSSRKIPFYLNFGENFTDSPWKYAHLGENISFYKNFSGSIGWNHLTSWEGLVSRRNETLEGVKLGQTITELTRNFGLFLIVKIFINIRTTLISHIPKFHLDSMILCLGVSRLLIIL